MYFITSILETLRLNKIILNYLAKGHSLYK